MAGRDLEKIRSVLGERPVELPLVYGARAYSPVLPLVGAVYAVLVGIALAMVLRVERSNALVLGCAVAGFALTIVRIHRRQGKVVVILDDAGIREMDGDVVRVSIPWEEGHASYRERRASYRGWRGTFELVDLKFASPDGRTIAFENHDSGFVFFPGHYFRSVTRVLPIAVIDVAKSLPPIPEGMKDDRTIVERGGLVLRTVAFVGSAVIAAGLWTIDTHAGGPHVDYVPTLPLSSALALSGILAFGSLLALVHPFVRMRRLAPKSAASVTESPYRTADRPPGDDAFRRRRRSRARMELVVRLALAAAFAAYPLVLRAALAKECHDVGSRDQVDDCDE